ncbi:MAG: FkbM family methyltransferase [Xanthobacteraceae bacterium]|nr:FkbM family methyltransferase [Xanthobacteraceae bacterium]
MTTQRSFSDILGRKVPTIEILDVGAMATGQERYHGLLATGLAQVTGFEPNPAEFARLKDRPGPYRYLPYFLGSGGPATFHLTRYPGCSSLLMPDPKVIDMFMTIGCADAGGNFHVVKTEPVETKRLDDIEPKVTADLIKVDAQGCELEIMRHGATTVSNALVIECEVEFVPLYKDQPLFGDVQCFLRDRGFVLHKLIDCAGRPFRPFNTPNPFLPMSQVLWADAIFVRDFTRLDAFGDDELLKAAAILDVVYASYDLVGLLLAEYDRRAGTSVRQAYVGDLQKRPSLSVKVLNIMDHPA